MFLFYSCCHGTNKAYLNFFNLLLIDFMKYMTIEIGISVTLFSLFKLYFDPDEYEINLREHWVPIVEE